VQEVEPREPKRVCLMAWGEEGMERGTRHVNDLNWVTAKEIGRLCRQLLTPFLGPELQASFASDEFDIL
jgi:hypothetical protein